MFYYYLLSEERGRSVDWGADITLDGSCCTNDVMGKGKDVIS